MQDWISATLTATSNIVARELYILLLALLFCAAGIAWWRRGGEELALKTLRRPTVFNLLGWWLAFAGLLLLTGYILLGVLPPAAFGAAALSAAAGVIEHPLVADCQEREDESARVHSALLASSVMLARVRGAARHDVRLKLEDAGYERSVEPHGGR